MLRRRHVFFVLSFQLASAPITLRIVRMTGAEARFCVNAWQYPIRLMLPGVIDWTARVTREWCAHDPHQAPRRKRPAAADGMPETGAAITAAPAAGPRS